MDARAEKARLDLTEAALTFVREAGISQRPVIWLASDVNRELLVSIYRSFVRCRFDASFPLRLPDPTLNLQEPLALGALLIVVSSADNASSHVAEALRSHRMALHDSRERVVSAGHSAVRITVGKVIVLVQG